jgi:hypothetical protein
MSELDWDEIAVCLACGGWLEEHEAWVCSDCRLEPDDGREAGEEEPSHERRTT